MDWVFLIWKTFFILKAYCYVALTRYFNLHWKNHFPAAMYSMQNFKIFPHSGPTMVCIWAKLILVKFYRNFSQYNFENLIWTLGGPSLAASLEPSEHCRNVASLSLFYRYLVDVYLNWLNWSHFLIPMGGYWLLW